ncbi:MAG: DUF4159 domain-containing protein [Planctomycetota bacterium]
MPKPRIALIKAVLVLALLSFFCSFSAVGQTDAEVDQAIARMKAWLYDQQDPVTGSFDDPRWSELRAQPYHATGETALITFALLLSGESHQDPRLAKAIEYLRNNRTESTYLAAMRAHIWARLPDDYLPDLDREAEYLATAEIDGRFHYQPDNPIWSNSLTQYGMLGMWEYAKRGGEVDDDFWRSVGEHIFADQNDDGGWGYNNRSGRGGGASTGSMTAAGIAILQIAQQRLARDEDEPDPRLADALRRGVEWLDQRFDPAVNPGLKTKYRFYYLYGIERLALANGLSSLNGRDWFAAGARFILDQENGRGTVRPRLSRAEMSSRIDTAFALSFLSRGRVPLWAGKLDVPGQASNNRPNDLYFLTRYLSDQREAELSWKLVSIEEDPESWLRAPLLYWSSNDRVQLTPEQQDRLKRYIGLGGTLMVNSEGRGSKFRRSVEAVMKELYPDYEFKPVKADHSFQSLISPLSGSASFRTLSNGVRDLVVMPRRDWGLTFQAEEAGKDRAWDAMTNVYAALTDRGRLRNRLDPPLPVLDAEREPSDAEPILVVRASYAGNWSPEPLAFEVGETTFFNQTGRALEISPKPLADIGVGDEKPNLIHLAGVEAVSLTDDELSVVDAYIGAGGTLLIETVGGLGDFAEKVADQFVDALGGERRWLDVSHPLITGEGLPGGADHSRVAYRAFTKQQGSAGETPQLAAVFVEGRPAVVISPRDLSLGILGLRHYRINGYAPASARGLLHNILLWSAEPRP